MEGRVRRFERFERVREDVDDDGGRGGRRIVRWGIGAIVATLRFSLLFLRFLLFFSVVYVQYSQCFLV